MWDETFNSPWLSWAWLAAVFGAVPIYALMKVRLVFRAVARRRTASRKDVGDYGMPSLPSADIRYIHRSQAKSASVAPQGGPDEGEQLRLLDGEIVGKDEGLAAWPEPRRATKVDVAGTEPL